MIEMCIPGEPISKARPKFARRGKFTQTYSTQETEEGKFIAQALQQLGGKSLDGPLRFAMVCVKSRPKNHYGTGRNLGKVKVSSPVHPTTTPDTDNYVKFVLDCLNGVAYKDDAQIVEISAVKKFGKNPRTEIIISKIKE